MKNERGFSIIEIMMASALALMIIPAIFAASFGTQSLIIGGETNNEAVAKAQKMLEDAEAQGRQDFNLVNATSSTEQSGAVVYDKELKVTVLPDFLTKRVEAIVSWVGDRGQSLGVALSTLVVDLEHVATPRTCSPLITDPEQWKTLASDSFTVVASDPSINFPVTDVTVFGTTLFVAVNSSHLNADPDLFMYDVGTDPKHPSLLIGTSTGPGLAAVRVARNVATGRVYAYLANTSTTAQLQIIDVTDPTHPIFIKGVKLTGNSAVATTLEVRNTMLYLGLKSAAGTGPEFNVFDISDPQLPIWKGGYSTNRHDINAIAVQKGRVYIARPTDTVDTPPEQITVFDVSDGSPVRVGGWKAPHLSGNGKSLFSWGNSLLVGRTVTATDPELAMLDVSNPPHLQTMNSSPVSKEIGNSVERILARDPLVFLITDKQFQIWNTSDPTQITLWGSKDLGMTTNSSLTCMNEYMYVGSVSPQGKGIISIVYPQL